MFWINVSDSSMNHHQRSPFSSNLLNIKHREYKTLATISYKIFCNQFRKSSRIFMESLMLILFNFFVLLPNFNFWNRYCVLVYAWAQLYISAKLFHLLTFQVLSSLTFGERKLCYNIKISQVFCEGLYLVFLSIYFESQLFLTVHTCSKSTIATV